MLISSQNKEIREAVFGFDRRIEEMHGGFQRYRAGEETKIPPWDVLERELLSFSRKQIMDLELRNQLESVLFKFQNRKKIWLRWVEEFQATPARRP